MTSADRPEDPPLLRADGHVADWVVSALADGQSEIIPPAVSAHVDACEACTERLVEMTLLSLSVGEAWNELAALGRPELVSEPRRAAPVELAARGAARPSAPFPLLPFFLALGFLALGIAPSFFGSGSLVTRFVDLAREGLGLARGARLVLSLDKSGQVLFFLSFATSLLAWAGGALVARRALTIEERLG